MHYLTAGPADGQPVLLLHGFPEAAYAWRGQWDRLADAGYRVIVPDQRGFNLTDKSGPYNLDTVVGDIVALMDACSMASACIAGHDWGGLVAFTLAGRHPTRVQKLLVLNVPHPAVMLGIFRNFDVLQWLRSWYATAFLIPMLPEMVLRAADFALLRGVLSKTSRSGSFLMRSTSNITNPFGANLAACPPCWDGIGHYRGWCLVAQS